MLREDFLKEVSEYIGLGIMTAGSKATPVKPAITATRMKGEDITELRPVVVGQKPGKVLLELTPRAAETLLIIHQWIGGDPGTTRRGDMDNIGLALMDVGVRLPNTYKESVGAYDADFYRSGAGLTFRPVA